MASKIGILGGTFNPIHNGHIKLALSALTEYALDKVLVMPSGISYLKKGIDILSGQERLKMAELAIASASSVFSISGLEVSDIEVKRQGNTYTYETLLELKEIYGGDAELYFIGGADTLKGIDSWKNPQIIFDNAALLIAVRDDDSYESLKITADFLNGKYGARVFFLKMEKYCAASSKIRTAIKNGEDVSGVLPSAVYEYIKENGLYGIS